MPTAAAGAIAQLGERLLCKQEVVGSIPSGSTTRFVRGVPDGMKACASPRLRRCGRACSTIVRFKTRFAAAVADRVFHDIVKRRFVRRPARARRTDSRA